MDDKILRVASEVYSAPKVYALLLGSGISLSAGIPTGQQLMDTLIRKITHPKHETIGDIPSEWFEKHFSENPTYGSVIERLGRNPADRSNLIRPYFERHSNDEAEVKAPTRAHQAVARLIKEGYIQVVLTTNFDRLLEQALEAQGISPLVIRTPQDAANSAPLQHLPVTIIKVHGDYQDIGILNTADELNEYDPAINKLLDKVLSEWGLIICGWSGESDTALRDRLLRAPLSPYSTHWITYQGDMRPEAKAIIDARKAEQIDTMGADAFFNELEQNVMALKSLDSIHEISPIVAAERVRRLLSANDLISLETWLNAELEQVHELFISQPFRLEIAQLCFDPTSYQRCVPIIAQRYFEALKTPIYMIATLCWFGANELHTLLSHTLEHWMEMAVTTDIFAYGRLPILLLVYTVGIAAIERENWQYLQSVLFEPFIPKKNQIGFTNYLVHLYEETFRRYHVQGLKLSLGSTIHSLLRPVFQTPLISSDDRYSRAFDLFELILNLAYLASPEPDPNEKMIPCHETLLHERSWDYIVQYMEKTGVIGDKWGLLHIEPFSAEQNNFEGLLKTYHTSIMDTSRRYGRITLPPNFAEAYKRYKRGLFLA